MKGYFPGRTKRSVVWARVSVLGAWIHIVVHSHANSFGGGSVLSMAMLIAWGVGPYCRSWPCKYLGAWVHFVVHSHANSLGGGSVL